MIQLKNKPYSDSTQITNLTRKLFLLIIVLVMLDSTGVTAIAETAAEIEPPPLEGMRVVAYSKAFAKRFGLPMPEPGFETTGGLEAVEFAIEEGNPWSAIFFSNYRLYVDSSLPIEFPEQGGRGDTDILITRRHFFGHPHEQFMKWRREDRIFFNEKGTRYKMKAFLATMDYGSSKQGALTSISYETFRQTLFEGLDYIHLYTSPVFFQPNHKAGIGLWLKKISAVDYRHRLDVEREQFVKMRLPEAFYKKVIELEYGVKKVNDINQRERYRKNRELKKRKEKKKRVSP